MATAAAETVFVDTNILLAATNESRPYHAVARRLLARGAALGLPCAWSGQIVREYICVATRPQSANGLGLSPEEALRNVEQFSRRLTFLDEGEEASLHLRGIVRLHGLTGKAVHDANVVATMAVHGVERLVTENAQDFERYPELRVDSLDAIGERLDRER